MRRIVRLNDSTSHGGHVKAVSARHFMVEGLPVARVGDICSCPAHGDVTIIEGNPAHTVDGIEVAYEGHQTSCGATLEATVGTFSL